MFGGFHAHALRLLGEARKKVPSSELQRELQSLESLLKGYPATTLVERRKILDKVSRVLRDLQEREKRKGSGVRSSHPQPAARGREEERRNDGAAMTRGKWSHPSHGAPGEKAPGQPRGGGTASTQRPERGTGRGGEQAARRGRPSSPGPPASERKESRFKGSGADVHGKSQAPPGKSRAPSDPLSSSVQYARGVGPKLAKKLERLGIATMKDLLYHFPRGYDDRRTLRQIRELQHGSFETVRGVIGRCTEFRPRPGLCITKISLTDPSGSLFLTWYNQPFRKGMLRQGQEVVAHGKVERRFREVQMGNPEVEILSQGEETLHTGRVVPVYPLTEGVSQPWLRRVIKESLDRYLSFVSDPLPVSLIQRLELRDLPSSLMALHFPGEPSDLEPSRSRLVFDEFFFLQLLLALKKKSRREERGVEVKVSRDLVTDFQASLPFSLTRAQVRVMEEIYRDMMSPQPMCRLIQGDVGSGKTVVAAFTAFVAAMSGYQAAIMVPTEILAEQQSLVLRELLSPYGLKVALFVGGLAAREREEVVRGLSSGSIQVAVGTHTLIQGGVHFRKLGAAIIDEQHKFGVAQRATLKEKGINPELLVMTATPIPRTLAMTLYGDLDISIIDELPPGRKEVKSYWVSWELAPRVYQFVRKVVGEGRQAFIVCPLIEESQTVRARSAVEEAQRLKEEAFPDLTMALLHGKMSAREKEEVMKEFRKKKFQILLSTTVIEVGVDVPNATCMVIQDADRFGLSQLHQLRGRVGRGEHDSTAILIADPQSEEGRERMKIFCQHRDGFAIAEEDLALRGPGEIHGTRQHGIPDLKIGDIVKDVKILELARKEAFSLLEEDPHLQRREHSLLRRNLEEKFQEISHLLRV